MKYGVIYSPETENLGDDILTYAETGFLPRVDYSIKRDDMDSFIPVEKEYVAGIFNGWYLYRTHNFPPSPYLIPLFAGIHFSPDTITSGYEYLDGFVTEYLKNHSPIGCRDMNTLELMQSKGIDSYFSGCLTLTLKPFENIDESFDIVTVDLNPDDESYVYQRFSDRDIVSFTHTLKEEEMYLPWGEERVARVEKALKHYQGANLVITSRLHVALPSMALGTPVILIGKFDEDFFRRMGDFSKYINTFSSEELIQGAADSLVINGFKNNRPDELINALRTRCEGFISELENNPPDTADLPELSEYRFLYADRVEHMKDKIAYLMNVLGQFIQKRDEDAATIQKLLEITKKLTGQ